ncbi:uncharacterized protein LOC133328144 [Musca vetustissima]|uniref:uncharacterized protein LOC133328144 n=1 Tax=Musca vetustissima TaxID=27455 RepID=UPI002AB7712C|nr:uncharacterized protein LOC133328144 [Musca vetustissima]
MTKWDRSYQKENKSLEFDDSNSSTKDRLQRLGYTTGYGTLNSYPATTGIAAYNPIKLDLGGVVLGTLVGIGAIIIIPKLLSAFHGGYAGYGRSENENDASQITNFVNKIDDILRQHNIDSTSCMQRAVCSYVRSTEFSMQKGLGDQMDEFVHILTENSLTDYMLDGTAIKEALDQGRNLNAKPCGHIYSNCPVNSETMIKMLNKFLPMPTNSQKTTFN